MELNYLVFGHTVFEVSDENLFRLQFPDSLGLEKRTIKLNQIIYPSTGGKVYFGTFCYVLRRSDPNASPPPE